MDREERRPQELRRFVDVLRFHQRRPIGRHRAELMPNGSLTFPVHRRSRPPPAKSAGLASSVPTVSITAFTRRRPPPLLLA